MKEMHKYNKLQLAVYSYITVLNFTYTKSIIP